MNLQPQTELGTSSHIEEDGINAFIANCGNSTVKKGNVYE